MELERSLGLGGAVLLGLGSILGTGVFVSLAVAVGIAGEGIVYSVALAAMLATCNGLSSAALAADHPVSGGTYAYGYRYLSPFAGYTAGWMFLSAKSASAATAALGFAGYLRAVAPSLPGADWQADPLALAAVFGLTLLVRSGLRRSNVLNLVLVTLTLTALGALVAVGFATPSAAAGAPTFTTTPSIVHGGALMFVAFAGYGRIATLGEEVRDPRRTIPTAIIITLVVSAVLYGLVAWVAVSAVGIDAMSVSRGAVAPLVTASEVFGIPGLTSILTAAAIAAMLGVLLNLVLGLSRVLLAMGRQGDAPSAVANVVDGQPTTSVWVMGAVIAVLVCIGDVRITWSLSAFTVLVYYGLTNLCALQLTGAARLYPRWVSVLGLVGCASLALSVDIRSMLIGVTILATGWGIRFVRQQLAA